MNKELAEIIKMYATKSDRELNDYLLGKSKNNLIADILEFPFKCGSFISKLEKQLNRRFPHGDITGQFLRSANFDYRDYIECKDLKVVFLPSEGGTYRI